MFVILNIKHKIHNSLFPAELGIENLLVVLYDDITAGGGDVVRGVRGVQVQAERWIGGVVV